MDGLSETEMSSIEDDKKKARGKSVAGKPANGGPTAKKPQGKSSTKSFARKALLIVQATLSVVLVAGSTMLARSLGNLQSQDFGFEVPGRVLVQLNKPPSTYTAEKLGALYRGVEVGLIDDGLMESLALDAVD